MDRSNDLINYVSFLPLCIFVFPPGGMPMSRNEGCHPGDRRHKLSSDHSGALAGFWFICASGGDVDCVNIISLIYVILYIFFVFYFLFVLINSTLSLYIIFTHHHNVTSLMCVCVWYDSSWFCGKSSYESDSIACYSNHVVDSD